jgi:hypothetical protein
MPEPIIVNGRPTREQAWSIVRTLLKIAGTVLAARGMVDGVIWEAVSGVILAIGPAIVELVKIRIDNAKLRKLANLVDDAVARVR